MMRLILGWLGLLILMGNGGKERESELVAAMSLKFSKYVEWKSERVNGQNTFNIIVLGDKALKQTLKNSTQDMKVKNRSVRLVEKDLGTPAHLIIIGSKAKANRQNHEFLSKCLCLIVSIEADSSFLETIRLYKVDDYLRFDIDLGQAQLQKTYISSRLLNLARSVTGP